MFQNKKLKRNATYTIAEVAEVALCASNCALPTSDIIHIHIMFKLVEECILPLNPPLVIAKKNDLKDLLETSIQKNPSILKE